MRVRVVLSVIVGTLVVGALVAVGTFESAQSDTGDFYFWRLGHMDGPHDSSMALGISRDGKTAVGSTAGGGFLPCLAV